MLERFDVVVIGSGPAGEKGAAQAAYFGKRVALIEREPLLGGPASTRARSRARRCARRRFIQEVFNHPTLGEACKYAAYDGLGARASS
jgi:phytoene dehydrogenase-like protein